MLESLHRSQAVIEFDPDGRVLSANDNFLAVMGYARDEVEGRHHRMFVDPAEADSPEYATFWSTLRDGTFHSAEYRRLGKAGREVWIQATYNPILDPAGTVTSVVKFASDITDRKRAERDIRDRTQARIEFEPDGTIVTANELFLKTVGYALSDIAGKHHRIFVTADEAASAEYQELWPALSQGEFRRGEFRRVNAAGDEIWLRGAYSPVFGSDGAVTGIVKSVSDITAEVHAQAEATRVGQAIAASVTQMAGATQQIATSVNGTTTLAHEAKRGVDDASARVAELEAASDTVGSVIDLITSLSGQTNLLALNATIEAARAGEAGKGFAVVADEVKGLASQTTAAAGDIRHNVEGIQGQIADAVSSIDDISASVTEVSSMSVAVASAVEQQEVAMAQLDSAATALLALNVDRSTAT